MASTSKMLLEWEEKQAVKQTWYATKTIEFFRCRTPIILQNRNGSCPLIAVCNILSLRNELGLSADVDHVSEADLLTLLADSLINALNGDENVYSISDTIDILPVLTKALGVNVKFKQIDDIEVTKGCAIFDILDIKLYHGWLIDPQDTKTSDAFGSKSYDTLMADLADLQILNMEALSMKNFEECDPLIGSELPTTVDPGEDNTTELEKRESIDENEKTSMEVVKETEKSDGECSGSRIRYDGDWITFETDPDKGSHDGQINASLPEKHESKDGTEKFSIEVVKNKEKLEGECSSPRIGYNDESVTFGEPISNEAGPSAPNWYEGEVGITAEEGQLIKNFIDNNPSQLTVYGLFCLRDGLKDRELCMLFRNDHFSTLLKFQGTLYTLVTDLGYQYQPGVVWEKLSEVDGDTELVNKNFKIYKPEIVECTWDDESLKRMNDYLYSAEATTSTSTNLSSDHQQELEEKQSHPKHDKVIQQQVEGKQSQQVLEEKQSQLQQVLEGKQSQLESDEKQSQQEIEEEQSEPQNAEVSKQLVLEAKERKQESEEKQAQWVSPAPLPTGSNAGSEHEHSIRPRSPTRTPPMSPTRTQPRSPTRNPPSTPTRDPPRNPTRKPSKKESKRSKKNCSLM